MPWNPELAIDWLKKNKGLTLQSETQTWAVFEVSKVMDIMVRRGQQVVTVYMNKYSVTNEPFPRLNGIEDTEYPIGVRGKNNFPGISGKVARIQSLNPEYNVILRLRVENEVALAELIDWYSGNPLPIQENDPYHDIANIITENPDPTTRKQQIEARLGQGRFRRNVIETWGLGECCAVTGTNITPLLIASHIIPWCESIEKRLEGTNGVLLCSHLDKLFDRHLIGFDSEGRLIASNRLSAEDWHQLNKLGIHNFTITAFLMSIDYFVYRWRQRVAALRPLFRSRSATLCRHGYTLNR